jgi:hypothetical protein
MEPCMSCIIAQLTAIEHTLRHSVCLAAGAGLLMRSALQRVA